MPLSRPTTESERSQNSHHQYDIRIFYEDTDAGGIVYYANYLKYFERSRTEWLRELGIKQSMFLEQNIAFVVRQVEMDNLASAKLDDLITVSSKIIQLKRATIVFQQQIFNQAQQLLCQAKVKVACVNLSLAKPCAIPSTILGAFERVS